MEVAIICTISRVSRNKFVQQIISIHENHAILHIFFLDMQERPRIQYQD